MLKSREYSSQASFSSRVNGIFRPFMDKNERGDNFTLSPIQFLSLYNVWLKCYLQVSAESLKGMINVTTTTKKNSNANVAKSAESSAGSPTSTSPTPPSSASATGELSLSAFMGTRWAYINHVDRILTPLLYLFFSQSRLPRPLKSCGLL